MKKLLALLLTFFASYPLFAQQPDAGMKSFSFGFSGLQHLGLSSTTGPSSSFLFRKYVTADRAHRYLINFSVQERVSHFESGAGSGSITTNSYHRSMLNIGYGFQRNLSSAYKLTPYWGIDFTIGSGYSKNVNRTEVTDSSKTGPGDRTGDYTEYAQNQGVPINVGVYPFLGLNYFLLKNFSIGAEFSYGLIGTYNFGTSNTTQSRQAGIDMPKQVTKSPNNYDIFGSASVGNLIMLSVYF